ncbi:PilZ domain-containing protein [Sphingomonas xanthus]|uniref:PilZ domain-containing protein n=1 Tax=Sphingomonas xanthus TaxID=2594473 RepID=A0A516IPS1_9SPHN|nr:PilZ domain-containing protein [Sphingomonas xanthus]
MLVPARMRVGASWSDASILNISSRGMLLRSAAAPPQGTYLEIRRGPHIVVARVVWSNTDRFGIRTQDPVCPDRLMSQAAAADGPPVLDRRARPRADDRAGASRRWGQALEFIVVASAGLAAALLSFGTVGEVLARPLAAVGTALN